MNNGLLTGNKMAPYGTKDDELNALQDFLRLYAPAGLSNQYYGDQAHRALHQGFSPDDITSLLRGRIAGSAKEALDKSKPNHPSFKGNTFNDPVMFGIYNPKRYKGLL